MQDVLLKVSPKQKAHLLFCRKSAKNRKRTSVFDFEQELQFRFCLLLASLFVELARVCALRGRIILLVVVV